MKQSRAAKVYLEDTVFFPKDNLVGVVDAVWHDIDNGSAGDDEALDEGEFRVCTLQEYGVFASTPYPSPDVRIVHEDSDEWKVVDRSFTLGDVCKLDSSSQMSGIVQEASMSVKIRHIATREERTVKGTEIQSHIRFNHHEFIVKDDWVGKARYIDARAIVRASPLSSRMAADVDIEYLDPDQFDEDDYYFPEQLHTGTMVGFTHNPVRRDCKVSTGGQVPTESSRGVVCMSYTSHVEVQWQFQNMMTDNFKSKPPPRADYTTEDLRNGELKPFNAANVSGSGHQVGDVVVYCGTSMTPASLDQYAFGSLDELKTLCTEWEVIHTEQSVTVKWQDGSMKEYLSRDLVPYSNVDDLDLWPSDNIVSMTNGREGIVQTVSAQDRTAIVRWTSGEVEEMSLYELRNNGSINIDLGDMVLIVPEDGNIQQSDSLTWGPAAIVSSISAALTRYLPLRTSTQATTNTTDEVTWFGQVLSMDEEGMCKVLLCFLEPPEIISCPLSRLIHVHSDTSSVDSDSEHSLEVDSTDSDSSTYESSEEVVAPWRDDRGVPLEDQQLDDWEDETDVNEEMIDVEAEEISAPDVMDIVLDVEPDAIHDKPTLDRDTEVSEAAKPVLLSHSEFPTDEAFASFKVLDTDPEDHTYATKELSATGTKMRRILKEYTTLSSALPPGILVRTYESRMDLLRVIIIGPLGTPYEYAPMLFDCYLPPTFPNDPPQVHFFSWTDGIGRINPNLYEDGKVCLSLLGTWQGNEKSESWSTESSLLQVFVSLQALVLVQEPYYNEAGYDALSVRDTQVAAANYSERAYVLTRGFIAHILLNPVAGFESEMSWFYSQHLQLIVSRSERVMNSEADSSECISRISKGAQRLLQRSLTQLRTIASA